MSCPTVPHYATSQLLCGQWPPWSLMSSGTRGARWWLLSTIQGSVCQAKTSFQTDAFGVRGSTLETHCFGVPTALAEERVSCEVSRAQCYLWHRPSGKAGSCPWTRGAGYPLHGGPEDGGFLLLAEGCPEACAEPWLSTICLPSPAGFPEHLCALHRSRGTVGHLGARCPSHTSLPIAHGCEVGSPKPQVGFRF